MQEVHNTGSIARGSGQPKTGDAPNAGTPLGQCESGALNEANSISTTDIDKPSAANGAERTQEALSIPTEVTVSSGSEADHSDVSRAKPSALPEEETPGASTAEDEASDRGQVASISRKRPEPPTTKAVHQLAGIEESLRGKDGALRNVQFGYSVCSDSARRFQQMVAQAQYARDPLQSVPYPTGKQGYGTTHELFARIEHAIAERTQLSDANSALLTYWILSTWFQDILPVAPGIAITGWAYEADVVLRTLMTYCYHPTLVAGITSATLNNFDWDRKPTLLISDPNLSKRMAVLLGSSTNRGYLTFRKLAGRPTSPFDYFSSKAVYLGEDTKMVSALQNYLHLNASSAPGAGTPHASPLWEKTTGDFQNQLLSYRIKCLPHVHASDFRAEGLSSGVASIANALGRCIVDAPDLQTRLVSLLTPYSQQQMGERLDDLGTLAIGAALALCHQGKDRVLVGDIASEVNRVLKSRGDRLQFSPEKVGHRLKKIGLFSRRISAAGNGFLWDESTQVFLHQVATAYGYVGLTENKENLHCKFCEQNK